MSNFRTTSTSHGIIIFRDVENSSANDLSDRRFHLVPTTGSPAKPKKEPLINLETAFNPDDLRDSLVKLSSNTTSNAHSVAKIEAQIEQVAQNFDSQFSNLTTLTSQLYDSSKAGRDSAYRLSEDVRMIKARMLDRSMLEQLSTETTTNFAGIKKRLVDLEATCQQGSLSNLIDGLISKHSTRRIFEHFVESQLMKNEEQSKRLSSVEATLSALERKFEHAERAREERISCLERTAEEMRKWSTQEFEAVRKFAQVEKCELRQEFLGALTSQTRETTGVILPELEKRLRTEFGATCDTERTEAAKVIDEKLVAHSEMMMTRIRHDALGIMEARILEFRQALLQQQHQGEHSDKGDYSFIQQLEDRIVSRVLSTLRNSSDDDEGEDVIQKNRSLKRAGERGKCKGERDEKCFTSSPSSSSSSSSSPSSAPTRTTATLFESGTAPSASHPSGQRSSHHKTTLSSKLNRIRSESSNHHVPQQQQQQLPLNSTTPAERGNASTTTTKTGGIQKSKSSNSTDTNTNTSNNLNNSRLHTCPSSSSPNPSTQQQQQQQQFHHRHDHHTTLVPPIEVPTTTDTSATSLTRNAPMTIRRRPLSAASASASANSLSDVLFRFNEDRFQDEVKRKKDVSSSSREPSAK